MLVMKEADLLVENTNVFIRYNHHGTYTCHSIDRLIILYVINQVSVYLHNSDCQTVYDPGEILGFDS